MNRIRESDLLQSTADKGISPQISQICRQLQMLQTSAAVEEKFTEIRDRIGKGNGTDLGVSREQLIIEDRNRVSAELCGYGDIRFVSSITHNCAGLLIIICLIYKLLHLSAPLEKNIIMRGLLKFTKYGILQQHILMHFS